MPDLRRTLWRAAVFVFDAAVLTAALAGVLAVVVYGVGYMLGLGCGAVALWIDPH